MRTLICTAVLILFTSLLGLGQAPAKPPVRTPAAASAEPAAIIHTTAGDLHCTLFSKQARSTAFLSTMALSSTGLFPNS